jgi:hypothetical protein
MAGYTAPHGMVRRGQTFYWKTTPPAAASAAESVAVEGYQATFREHTAPGATGAAVKGGNRDIVAILVRNVAGFNLASKRLVKWAAGYIGRRVDGYTHLSNATNAAGVIDDLLTGGLPDKDLGWLIVQGPVLVKTSLAADATNVIAENARLVALTGAASNSTTSGRVQAFVMSSSVTVTGDQIIGILGRALSAKTTAQTDQDMRIYLDLLKA